MCFALVIQYAMRVRHVVICSLSRYTIFFHIISKTARFFFLKKRVTEQKICVLISLTKFVWNVSHSKKKWARYDQKRKWPSCKIPVILVWFEWKLNFLNSFSKTQIWNLMKIRLVGAELSHSDRLKDRHDDTNCRFSQFCGSSWKKERNICYVY